MLSIHGFLKDVDDVYIVYGLYTHATKMAHLLG